MSKLHELSWRTNINTYTFRGKHIVVYLGLIVPLFSVKPCHYNS